MNTTERLKAARQYRNISQKQIADLLKITSQSYSAKERGISAGFSPDDLSMIINFLEIDARWIHGQISCDIVEADLKMKKYTGDSEEIAQLLDELKSLKLKKSDIDPVSHRVSIDNNLRKVVDKINKLDRKHWEKIETFVDGIRYGIEVSNKEKTG